VPAVTALSPARNLYSSPGHTKRAGHNSATPGVLYQEKAGPGHNAKMPREIRTHKGQIEYAQVY